ncbi:cupin domain-containing protein [Psychroserpens luteolus]|uniref:cupin domain-containing protein n=1 Tax=Psychroserpens luteolus TaxID=2855840 RepID=UPI001E3A439B|nr:cupin domain-containing protein [Psychroserpens luteolus]MCD2260308.1 cupin domain-containing protein [Psychroserpens luteolus]
MTIEISNIPQKEIITGFKARFVHSAHTTTAFWEVEAGAELPIHSHIHEQISMVTEGQFQMTIDNVTKVYTPGMLVIIPSNIEHSGKALTACKITDVFSPVREDYK